MQGINAGARPCQDVKAQLYPLEKKLKVCHSIVFRSLLATSSNPHQIETTMGPMVAFPSETRPWEGFKEQGMVIGLAAENRP